MTKPKKKSDGLPKTRKQIRKEKRDMKKLHRKRYYENNKNKRKEVGQFVRFPNDDADSEICENLLRRSDKTKPFKTSKFMDIEKDKEREDALKSAMREQRKNRLLKANEDEDKIIKKLEKQLKFKKNKCGTLPKTFISDGLDYILDVCDPKTMSAAVLAEQHLARNDSESEFEEDLAIATGQKIHNKSKQCENQLYESDEEYSDEDDDFGSYENSDDVNENNSDEDIDMEETEEGELSEEELHMLYMGTTTFPDSVCRSENLTPIREETESDLDLYKKGVEITCSLDESVTNDSIDNIPENSIEETLSDTCVDSYSDESDGSICDGYISSPCDEFEPENEQIIVNGKIINTYGRELNPKIGEEDFIRCPELDKILANISDSESEFDKINTNKDIYKPSSKESNKKEKVIEEKGKKRKKSFMTNSDLSLVNKVQKSADGKFVRNVNKNITDDEDESFDEDDLDFENEEFSDQSSIDLNEDKQKINNDDTWEDIYGRKRNKIGDVISDQKNKYIPPHLRKIEDETESLDFVQLKKQIKSLLNKVAGSNMHWISSQMETLYNSNSRNSVNNAFCSLWMSAILQSVTTSERMAIEHSALVAILHANVGSEIGAHFLQTLMNRFSEMIKVDQNLENKELDNLVLGLAQMYNFKIFHSSLLYEILDKFVQNLIEKNIECVLVVLRSVGGVLRKDDPAALKVFIHNTQEKASRLKNSATGSRINFLLDVLLAIKNNNLNKIPNYDPSYAEELKKSIKVSIRRGNTIVPLNIKLDDLLNVNGRGRWWIVGSAWENNTKQENKTENKKEQSSQQQHLLKLADKLRINTDLRRNIFCIIMSAEDYVDAFEKLQHLGLKHQQEREIIHVLIACCLHEKIYNQYYAVLAQRFCDYDRKFQMSIQYTVWDKLKDLDTFHMFQITNLAQFLTHLFIEKGLPISILKVVQFSELSKPTLRLMRQILLGILLHKNSQSVLEVFQRIALSQKLHLLRESLRLFISHFLVKNTNRTENVLNEEQEILLKDRVSAVDKILLSDSKLKF